MGIQQRDYLARVLARGTSRRSALQGVAVALGLSAAGAREAVMAAPACWQVCEYRCSAGDVRVCQNSCPGPGTAKRIKGESCAAVGQSGCLGSKSTCQALL